MPLITRPKNLLDIQRGTMSPFSRLRARVNLSYSSKFRIPYLRRCAQIGILIFLAVYASGSSVLAPTSGAFAAQTDEERKELEAQLSNLERQIAEHEATIAEYRKQGTTLQSEINRLSEQVSKINLQIRAVTVALSGLNVDIEETESQIGVTEDTIARNKYRLADILRTIYESDDKGVVAIFLEYGTISDFASDINNLLAVQDGLRATVERIAADRERLIDQKQLLAVKRSDALALKAYQDSQKASIQATQKEKSTLLTITKGEESRYQQIVQEKKKSAAEIRSRIFQLLGGGELTFEQAYNLAKLAESATGVRAAFTLAILDRESALGQNVGKCSYKTAMSPTRDIPTFLKIVEELNIDPDSVTVSCANSDGAYGGAMGPAQFIPSTWAIYKDRIASVTGNNPPSPWRNSDAFVATALYIKDSVTSCKTIYSKQNDYERCAAAKYYAGSRWKTYLWTYGDRTVTRANQFQADIEAISA